MKKILEVLKSSLLKLLIIPPIAIGVILLAIAVRNRTAPEKAEEREPLKTEIQYDDFAKLDFRTGTILSAEKVKKADKLLKLSVDLGFEVRTVVSGIAEFFKPEEIIGQQVVVVANLAPRKLRGIQSQGMILMAEDAEGKLGFVNAKEGFGNGFVVR